MGWSWTTAVSGEFALPFNIRVEKRRRVLEREIANLTQAIADIGLSDALRKRLQEAELEWSQLHTPATTPAPDFSLRLVDRYRDAIANLRNIPTARTALADLLGEVPLSHDGLGMVAELGGFYSGLMTRIAPSVKVVAGARFELTTFGL